MGDYEERIEEVNKEISSIKKALKTAERQKQTLSMQDGFEDGAEQIRALYQSLKDVGFSEEQSFDLLKFLLDKGMSHAI